MILALYIPSKTRVWPYGGLSSGRGQPSELTVYYYNLDSLMLARTKNIYRVSTTSIKRVIYKGEYDKRRWTDSLERQSR